MANNFEQFPQEKFQLVNENRPLRDKELVTKPRGFFADAMYRFSRNKGSIVAAVIIGVLFLYAIIAPWCTPYKVATTEPYYKYVLPKLFDNENIDWYDGAANKSVNESTFLLYYGIGAESGVNAIKRQAYSTYVSDTTGDSMYNIRLDSYRAVGSVFMTGVSRDDYYAIQDYQDETGIQVIYPITDPAKRPEATQDQNNANYWFETEKIGGMTQPVNYTFKEDGSVEYTNIYLEYTRPSLRSERDFASTYVPNTVLEPCEGGFRISFASSPVAKNASQPKEGEEAVETKYEYLCLNAEENNNFPELSALAGDASVFRYDSNVGGLVTTVNGHDDPELDGDYYLGIPADRGSNILIIQAKDYSEDAYLLLNAYATDGLTRIEDVSVKTEGYLSSMRLSTDANPNYLAIDSMNLTASLTDKSASGKYTFVAHDDGYAMQLSSTGKFKNYATITFTGSTYALGKTQNLDEATTWYFNEMLGALYMKNGSVDYYWCVDLRDGTTKTGLYTYAETTESEDIVPFVLYEKTTTPATSYGAGTYYLAYNPATYVRYYANGYFDGDNYYSDQRLEGAGNYKYCYARSFGDSFEIRVNYYEYHNYYHTRIAKDGIGYAYYLFGADDQGKDIFVCLASGARFSFILAITVSLVNMTVGAIYGAIEGYYGGKADLIMERIVEILSAVPFMIVITLLKYHMGTSPQVLILFIAFFLTGWIGESGLVRMQFYRFKNQEYVLAARTLGAKDPRIMFRHIFPNALGTIVTSSVLVIPSMIFSETSLSYLGIINLSTGDMTSVGTMLANGQPYLTRFPHMIIFPAVFISLLMLTFNLFGNGLRDAFNPSLRGTED